MKFKTLTDFNIAVEFLQSTFSSPSHWPDWNIVISKYYNTRFYYFAAYHDDQLTGIYPVHETKKGMIRSLGSGQIYFNPYGGWIFNRPTEISLKGTPLRIDQAISCFTLPLIEEFNAMYSARDKRKEFQTLLVDLKTPYEKIFTEVFAHRVRNAIRKAEKNNVTVKVIEDLDLFHHHYTHANQKRGLLVQPKEFFTTLFTNSGHIKFDLSCAMVDQKLLGFDLVSFDKNYAIGFWNYLLPDAPKLGQGVFLMADSIKRHQQYGCQYFDLTFIEKERLPLIYEFKKGFSNLEAPILHYTNTPFSYKITNKLQKVLPFCNG